MQYGIDVSHHQNPATLPWAKFEGAVQFVICRSGYGAQLRDRQVAGHAARARSIGAKVGLYHFYRSIHTVQAQWELLRSVADQIGLTDGDIVPAIDIERDPVPGPGREVHPSWSAPCHEFVDRIVEEFGNAMVYITQREWKMLGSPAWVLERPLWVAHYTNASKPATPNDVQATIWQHRVGRFDPKGPGGYDKEHPELDQNRALAPLPLMGPPSDHGIEDLLDRAALEHFEFTELADA